MIRTLGVVQPCVRAPRLPNRYRRKLGGKSWLEWAVHRAADSLRVDRLVVVLADDVEGCKIAPCVPPDVDVMLVQGDALRCLAEAVESYRAESVVCIGADNPFVDPVLMDRLVADAEQHGNCDYVSYCVRGGRPIVQSPLGIFAEWCRGEAVCRADREASDPTERREPTRYIYSHPEQFQVRLLPAPQRLDRDDIRLRVDVEEDWLHTETIFEVLGPEGLEWQQIASLLEVQPALRARMAHLNRTLAAD